MTDPAMIRQMAVVCWQYKLAPSEYWALDQEETAALIELLDEVAAGG